LGFQLIELIRGAGIRVEEAKKAQEAEKLTEAEAEREAKEKDKEAEKRMRQEAEKEKQIIYSLGQIEKVCEELQAGKMGTKEALEKLKDLSDKIPE